MACETQFRRAVHFHVEVSVGENQEITISNGNASVTFPYPMRNVLAQLLTEATQAAEAQRAIYGPTLEVDEQVHG